MMLPQTAKGVRFVHTLLVKIIFLYHVDIVFSERCLIEKQTSHDNGSTTEWVWCNNGCCLTNTSDYECCEEVTLTQGAIYGIVVVGAIVLAAVLACAKLRLIVVRKPNSNRDRQDQGVLTEATAEEIEESQQPPPSYWSCVSPDDAPGPSSPSPQRTHFGHSASSPALSTRIPCRGISLQSNASSVDSQGEMHTVSADVHFWVDHNSTEEERDHVQLVENHGDESGVSPFAAAPVEEGRAADVQDDNAQFTAHHHLEQQQQQQHHHEPTATFFVPISPPDYTAAATEPEVLLPFSLPPPDLDLGLDLSKTHNEEVILQPVQLPVCFVPAPDFKPPSYQEVEDLFPELKDLEENSSGPVVVVFPGPFSRQVSEHFLQESHSAQVLIPDEIKETVHVPHSESGICFQTHRNLSHLSENNLPSVPEINVPFRSDSNRSSTAQSNFSCQSEGNVSFYAQSNPSSHSDANLSRHSVSSLPGLPASIPHCRSESSVACFSESYSAWQSNENRACSNAGFELDFDVWERSLPDRKMSGLNLENLKDEIHGRKTRNDVKETELDYRF